MTYEPVYHKLKIRWLKCHCQSYQTQHLKDISFSRLEFNTLCCVLKSHLFIYRYKKGIDVRCKYFLQYLDLIETCKVGSHQRKNESAEHGSGEHAQEVKCIERTAEGPRSESNRVPEQTVMQGQRKGSVWKITLVMLLALLFLCTVLAQFSCFFLRKFAEKGYGMANMTKNNNGWCGGKHLVSYCNIRSTPKTFTCHVYALLL